MVAAKDRISNKRPGYTGGYIVCFTDIPRLPDLVSQFFINQQGFDVDIGEHGGIVADPRLYCLLHNQTLFGDSSALLGQCPK